MNKRLTLLLAILLIVLLFICVGAGFVLFMGHKTVTLTLVDSQTRQPIEQATIQAKDSPVMLENGSFVIDVSDSSLGIVPQLML